MKTYLPLCRTLAWLVALQTLVPDSALAEPKELSPWPPARPGALILVPELAVTLAADGELEIGGYVGGGGVPSQFYLWARETIESPQATEAQFLELSRHPHQAIRTIGMAGLAERGGPAAIARLKELLSSSEGSNGHPAGCLPSWIYEGNVAWQFLACESQYLCRRAQIPPLSQAERLALTVEVLYRDDCAGARGFSSGRGYKTPQDALAEEFLTGRHTLTLEGLRTMSPGVPDHLLVKAAGRMPFWLVSGFLLQTAHDTKSDAKTRLAAATALLHGIQRGRDYPADMHLFSSLREKLNPLSEERFGDLYLRIYQDCPVREILGDWDQWEEFPSNKPGRDEEYGRLFSMVTMNQRPERHLGGEPPAPDDSPVMLALALESGKDHWQHNSNWQQLANYLNLHAGEQRRWMQDWNAFADTFQTLELLLRRIPNPEFDDPVPEADRKAVLEAVENILRLPPKP